MKKPLLYCMSWVNTLFVCFYLQGIRGPDGLPGYAGPRGPDGPPVRTKI